MAGNSKRRGAVSKRTKGNPTAGSGGRRRRSLQGKGPTPRAEERPNHKAYRSGGEGARRGRGAGGKGGTRRGQAEGAEWVAGRNAVADLIRAGAPVSSLHVVEGAERDGRLREILRLAAERGLGVLESSRAELDRATGGAVHQGVAARVPAYEYAHPDDLLTAAAERDEDPLLVVVDGVTDPRNLGAVIRSAEAFGAHGVVVPQRRAAGMTATAWKASAGAASRVPVARAVNLTRQLTAYQKAGVMVAGLAADGEVALPDLEAADGPLALVVGSEGQGLSRLVAQTCDVRVAIPMVAEAESLNAGVAAGVALYAVAQARR